MEKRQIRDVALLAVSVCIDIVQEFVLFNAALCSIPSISGVGVVITAICGLAVIGITGLSSLFAVAWGVFAYWLTKDEIFLGAGVLEIFPGINGLPIFTGAALYYLLTRKREGRASVRHTSSGRAK